MLELDTCRHQFLTHGQEKGPANMHNPHILQRIVWTDGEKPLQEII